MKTTRYRFEQAVQEVKAETTEWLEDEFKAVLESDKDFTRKADYIGLSLLSLDTKVASLDEEIKELQSLKKKLKSAKDIALTVGAKVFAEYGVEKLEGVGISSITVMAKRTKVKETLSILDEDALIELGYYKKVLDTEAIQRDLGLGANDAINRYTQIEVVNETTSQRLRVNKKRNSLNTQTEELLEEIAS